MKLTCVEVSQESNWLIGSHMLTRIKVAYLGDSWFVHQIDVGNWNGLPKLMDWKSMIFRINKRVDTCLKDTLPTPFCNA